MPTPPAGALEAAGSSGASSPFSVPARSSGRARSPPGFPTLRGRVGLPPPRAPSRPQSGLSRLSSKSSLPAAPTPTTPRNEHPGAPRAAPSTRQSPEDQRQSQAKGREAGAAGTRTRLSGLGLLSKAEAAELQGSPQAPARRESQAGRPASSPRERATASSKVAPEALDAASRSGATLHQERSSAGFGRHTWPHKTSKLPSAKDVKGRSLRVLSRRNARHATGTHAHTRQRNKNCKVNTRLRRERNGGK